jgi:hypothetical protein
MEEVMNKAIRIMVLGLLGLTMVPVQAFNWEKALPYISFGGLLSTFATVVTFQSLKSGHDLVPSIASALTLTLMASAPAVGVFYDVWCEDYDSGPIGGLPLWGPGVGPAAPA